MPIPNMDKIVIEKNIPTDWRLGNISATFKKGSKHDAAIIQTNK